ncbi:uncharacterized protein LOC105428420 isoform X2 [Pogonomyrmex barbatus]|uniref:Uncharacterized protein LOC105428420 isoform X2 n=1 Tax=Pogonomyrmex barbatus TaxID=144034 RepID=A0A6I9WI89_9HYME|nr:uncharacterized protein LOC105428420 isoform X2 [Pogonomyrmex barbatus]
MVLLAIRTIFAIFRKRKVAAVSFQRIIGTTRDTDLRALRETQSLPQGFFAFNLTVFLPQDMRRGNFGE